jgi:hypothetical protein
MGEWGIVPPIFHENKNNLFGNVQNKIYETESILTIDCILYKRADHNTLPNHTLRLKLFYPPAH